jgi:hypothetical protein
MLKTSPPAVKIRSTGLLPQYASREDAAVNYEVIRLVLYGFATSAIAYHTGMTCAQVQNRVRMYKLQGERSLFRTGQTANAHEVMQLSLLVSAQKKAGEKEVYQLIRNEILEAFKKGKPRKG